MRIGGPRIDASMLIPLLVMAMGFALLFAALLLLRMRTALERAQGAGAAPQCPGRVSHRARAEARRLSAQPAVR